MLQVKYFLFREKSTLHDIMDFEEGRITGILGLTARVSLPS